MSELKFLEPTTLPETIRLLNEYGADGKIIAGATALVLFMQQKLINPAALISLAHVAGLHDISVAPDGTLYVGAMVPLAEVAVHPQVRAGWPVLAEACHVVANVRIRNQATLGGNMAEADFASDPPAALVALDGSVTVISPEGTRQIRLAEFFLGLYSTVLTENDVITEIVVPPLPTGAVSTYLKFKSRASEDRPCVGIAAALTVKDGICSHVKVAIGAACPTPQRFPNLEQQLIGQRLTPTLLDDFAKSYAAALLDPMSDLRGSDDYRRAMSAVHTRRALQKLASLGGGL
jgi:carbon-monoxide dehydrogenase medium subunit